MAGILDVFDKVSVPESFAKVLDKTEILDFNVNLDKKEISVDLKADFLIGKPALYTFADTVKENYGLNGIDINIKYENVGFTDDYYRSVLYTLFRKSGSCKPFFAGSTAEIKDNTLILKGVRRGSAILDLNKFFVLFF